jgi:hypothetical protein
MNELITEIFYWIAIFAIIGVCLKMGGWFFGLMSIPFVIYLCKITKYSCLIAIEQNRLPKKGKA